MKTLDQDIDRNQKTPKETLKDWSVHKIRDIADVNVDNINAKRSNLDIIQYIDISSVEKGFIIEEKFIALKDAPVRAKRIVKDSDILISTVRPNLKHYVFIKEAKNNMIASTGFVVVRAIKIEPRYLYYFLTTQAYTNYLAQIAETHAGTYPSFKPDIILDTDILIPKEKEQKAITRILGSIDDKIDLNNKMNSTLESLAQSLFHCWFVRFDPFRDGEFEESKLGKIPKGWKVEKFTGLYAVGGGGTPKTSIEEYWGGDILWASGKDISQNEDLFLIKTNKNITKLGLERSSAKIYPRNTVVITARGTVGKTAILSKKIAISQTCYALYPKNDRCHFFLYLLVQKMIESLKKQSYGAIFDTITTRIFEEYQIIIPNENVLTRFIDLVEPIFNRVLYNQKQNEILIQLRTLLLPQLLSGKLRVNNPAQFGGN